MTGKIAGLLAAVGCLLAGAIGYNFGYVDAKHASNATALKFMQIADESIGECKHYKAAAGFDESGKRTWPEKNKALWNATSFCEPPSWPGKRFGYPSKFR